MKKLAHIETSYSLNTGGGMMVDVLILTTGHVLTVTDDLTVHHDSEEEALAYLGGEREVSDDDILTHY